MAVVTSDPMFVVPDPLQPVFSDSPPPLPYDRRQHSEILDDAATRLRRNGVAAGGYWRTSDGTRLSVDEDVSGAPTCMLGSLIPLHPDGRSKIRDSGQISRTTPLEVSLALRAAADDMVRERFPNAPSFVDQRSGNTNLSRVNDWLVEQGHADVVPVIVDRAHGYL